jgi:hypothetical protein
MESINLEVLLFISVFIIALLLIWGIHQNDKIETLMKYQNENIKYLHNIEREYSEFKYQLKLDYENKLVIFARNGRSDIEIYSLIRDMEDILIEFETVDVDMDVNCENLNFGSGWSYKEVEQIEL